MVIDPWGVVLPVAHEASGLPGRRPAGGSGGMGHMTPAWDMVMKAVLQPAPLPEAGTDAPDDVHVILGPGAAVPAACVSTPTRPIFGRNSRDQLGILSADSV